MSQQNHITSTEYSASEGALTASLIRQLELLIATPKGTVVFDRNFGVDTSCLDMPPAVAQAMLAAELAEQIETYIPQLALNEIQLSQLTLDGAMHLKAVIELVG